MELTYAEDLILRVRDNGIGIDPAIVSEGKDGHFALQGMRERAGRIMSKLTVETSTSSGTEIKLVVPGSIIYRRTVTGNRKLRASNRSLNKWARDPTQLIPKNALISLSGPMDSLLSRTLKMQALCLRFSMA